MGYPFDSFAGTLAHAMDVLETTFKIYRSSNEVIFSKLFKTFQLIQLKFKLKDLPPRFLRRAKREEKIC